MAVVIGYAVSPIDLIPDFIPVLGYLDDLIIIPAGIYLAIKMIPKGVFTECREKARTERNDSKTKWIMCLVAPSLSHPEHIYNTEAKRSLERGLVPSIIKVGRANVKIILK